MYIVSPSIKPLLLSLLSPAAEACSLTCLVRFSRSPSLARPSPATVFRALLGQPERKGMSSLEYDGGGRCSSLTKTELIGPSPRLYLMKWLAVLFTSPASVEGARRRLALGRCGSTFRSDALSTSWRRSRLLSWCATAQNESKRSEPAKEVEANLDFVCAAN